MTISSSIRKAGPYVGTGSQTVFPFAFKIFSASDLYVVRYDTATKAETVLTLTTHYTVSVNADQDNSPGGSVTLLSALASGYTLTLTSKLDYLQPTDLTNQGGFYPEVITTALDRATVQIQQLAEQVDRCPKVQISSSANVDVLSAATLAVANDLGNVDTVAGSLGEIGTVSGNISKVNTVADNVADVTNFADVYYGPSATDPTTRKDGSALQYGDLYYNTGALLIYVYGSTGWLPAQTPTPVTVTTQIFSGTGSQTAFTLSSAPAFLNALDVHISGVNQVPGVDYTLSGMSLSFTTAPPLGTGNILCRWISPYAGGVPDDGSVTAAKFAPGAVEAVCRNKLHNPLFSVAQRGGSGTVANYATNWLFDRWRTRVVNVDGCSLTVSASSMVIGGKPRKSMKVTNVDAVASLPADALVNPFTQGIEGRDLVDMLGDSATIRCYVRASVAGTYNASLSVRNADGTVIKCFNTRVSIPANTITPIEFTLPTDAANWVCEDSANVGAYLSFCAVGGANYQATTVGAWVAGNRPFPTGLTNWLATAGATVELCMPQLVRGTVAGEFDCLPDWLEGERCYYYLPSITSPTSDNGTPLSEGYASSSAIFIVTCQFNRRVRGKPTGVSVEGSYRVNAGPVSVAVSSLAFNGSSSEYLGILIAGLAAAVTPGDAGALYYQANSFARILFTGLEI